MMGLAGADEVGEAMIRSRMSRLLGLAVVTGVVAVLMPAGQASAGRTTAAPLPRQYAMMAYDAADGQVVLFGGWDSDYTPLSDTWTWDGTSWTERHPLHSPLPRAAASMVYDASMDRIVLFGGRDSLERYVQETWTWDGTDWTELHPVHSPSGRNTFGMAYDAADQQIVVYGGADLGDNFLDDTWTWDGTDWTQRFPVNVPTKRSYPNMTYDAANGQVVLFGGNGGGGGSQRDTWTWDGTDWTLHTVQHAPRGRLGAGMAYDDAVGRVVLFGGQDENAFLDSTWTWDGTDWTKQLPAHSPPRRVTPGMAYDTAHGRVVLFGGVRVKSGGHTYGDTWTWDGTDWTQRLTGSITVDPQAGEPGSVVTITGWGFAPDERVRILFVDALHGNTVLERAKADQSGGFQTDSLTIPAEATLGRQHIRANGATSGQVAKMPFRVVVR
jgi:Galactose oxidase, central domain